MGTRGCPGIYKWTWNWRAAQARRGSWTGTRAQAISGGVTGTPSVLLVGTMQQKQGESSLKVVLKPGLNTDKLTRLTKTYFADFHLGSLAVALYCSGETGPKIQENNFKTNIDSSHANLLLLSSNAFIVSHEMSDGRKLNLCRLPESLVMATARAWPCQQQDKDWEAGLLPLPLSPWRLPTPPPPPHRPRHKAAKPKRQLKRNKPAQPKRHLSKGLHGTVPRPMCEMQEDFVCRMM